MSIHFTTLHSYLYATINLASNNFYIQANIPLLYTYTLQAIYHSNIFFFTYYNAFYNKILRHACYNQYKNETITCIHSNGLYKISYLPITTHCAVTWIKHIDNNKCYHRKNSHKWIHFTVSLARTIYTTIHFPVIQFTQTYNNTFYSQTNSCQHTKIQFSATQIHKINASISIKYKLTYLYYNQLDS